MTGSSNEQEAANLIAEAAALKVEPPLQLPATAAANRTALAKLIGNANQDVELAAQSREYAVPLDSDYYVKEIRLTVEGDPKGQFEFFWTSISDSTKKRGVGAASNGQVAIRVNAVISAFSVKPPARFLGVGRVTIKSVGVVGLPLSTFNSRLDQLAGIEKLQEQIKAQAAKLQQEIAAHGQIIAGHEAQAEALESKIAELQGASNTAESELTSLRDKIAEAEKRNATEADREKALQARQAAIEQEVLNKQSEATNLMMEVSNRSKALRELKGEINLFPTEVLGFVNEGAGAISKYLLLAFLPTLLIVGLGYDLYDSAKDFLASAHDGTIGTLYAMLGRMPYVVVAFAILGAAYKITALFAREIIEIYRQRLNLTKLSILAKDVSDVCANELDLDDEQRYEARIYLKMQMLREHLKTYLPETFEYRRKNGDSPKGGDENASGEDDDSTDTAKE